LQNSQAWQAILAEVELFSFDVAWGCGATRFVQYLGAAAKKIQVFRHAATVAVRLFQVSDFGPASYVMSLRI
jgi:hypothetical protein